MMFSWRTGKCSQVVLREGDFSGLRSHKEPAPAAAASEAVVIEPGSAGMVLPQMELQLLAVGSQSHSTPVVPPQQLPATARALGLCLPSNTPTWPSPTAISLAKKAGKCSLHVPAPGGWVCHGKCGERELSASCKEPARPPLLAVEHPHTAFYPFLNSCMTTGLCFCLCRRDYLLYK